MKKTIDADMERILKNNIQFLMDVFIVWCGKEEAQMANFFVEIVSPRDIDWETKKKDKDDSEFGKYTMNPDMAGINWENIPLEKIKTLDFYEFVGRPKWELAKHLAEKYFNKYHIPGIEFWKYLHENGDKIPQELKNESHYYFFGSILRDRNGNWIFPKSYQDGVRWYLDASWLGSNWCSNNSVLLLEK